MLRKKIELPPLPDLENLRMEIHDVNIDREKEYIDALHRRIDEELRERRAHVEEADQANKQKEAELERLHQQILDREKQAVISQTDPDRIKALEKELEDQKISLEYQKSELERRLAQVAEREKKLDAREEELKKREAAVAEKPVVSLAAAPQPIKDDAYALENKYQQVVEQQVVPAKGNAKQLIRKQVSQAYIYLEHAKLDEARKLYQLIKDQFKAYTAHSGADQALYQEIVRLYGDIVHLMKTA